VLNAGQNAGISLTGAFCHDAERRRCGFTTSPIRASISAWRVSAATARGLRSVAAADRGRRRSGCGGGQKSATEAVLTYALFPSSLRRRHGERHRRHRRPIILLPVLVLQFVREPVPIMAIVALNVELRQDHLVVEGDRLARLRRLCAGRHPARRSGRGPC